MKLGYVTWYSGWACLTLGIVGIIAGIVTGELHVVGKGIGGLIFGFIWLKVGAGQIQKAKLEEIGERLVEKVKHEKPTD